MTIYEQTACRGCGQAQLVDTGQLCPRCEQLEGDQGEQLGLLEVPAASLFGEPSSRQQRRQLAADHRELVDLLREATCPTCGAKPGSPCKRPSGHTVFGGDVHSARRALIH